LTTNQTAQVIITQGDIKESNTQNETTYLKYISTFLDAQRDFNRIFYEKGSTVEFYIQQLNSHIDKFCSFYSELKRLDPGNQTLR
jgi:hypothetical protein